MGQVRRLDLEHGGSGSLVSGQYLLQASLDSSLLLVDYEQGKTVRRYCGHKATEYCSTAAFITGPKGVPLVACGSEDGALVIWDVDSKEVSTQGQNDYGGSYRA